jgi:dinuclear metal center YbgI/SA1388 family protein
VSAVTCDVLAGFLDGLLGVAHHADYPNALNGLQLANRAPTTRIAAAVDLSLRAITLAQRDSVNFLIVHHGMFWGGLQHLVGPNYERLRSLLDADMAVYSVHLPLDSSPVFGNAVLLARRLGLEPTAPFARYGDVHVGVRGECDVATAELVQVVAAFANKFETTVRTTPIARDQRTRSWAICTGAGASTDTLREAATNHIDTLIVGEGPHHTAVDAGELGITVVYAGHYATEALGVQAIAQRVAAEYGLPWQFVSAPTGL